MEDEPNGGPEGGRLGDYLDGILSDAERKAFEAELSADPERKAEADQLRKLEALIEGLPYEEEVPAPVTARIRAALEAEALEAGATRGAVVPGPGGEARVERRSVPIFRLSRAVWVAAAVVLVAVLLWLVTRPPAVPPTSRSMARLFIGKMIGGVIEDPGTRYSIYDPGLERVYHTLNLRDDRAALSYNNAKLLLEWPNRELKRDANGRLDLADLRPDDERLVRIHAADRLDAFGLIERVERDDGMMQAAVLFPGKEIAISGRVLDAMTGQPIRDAILIARDGTGFLRADADGRFQGDIESITDRPPLLHVFAEGYAEGTRRLDRQCLATGTFEDEFRLDQDLRFTRTIEVVGQDGKPLAGAVIMAYAIPPDGDAGRVPGYKRDRPEIGITDDGGAATLYQLLDCHYRVEIHHENGYFASHEFDPAGSVSRFQVKPAGPAQIHLSTVDPKGRPLPVGRVILSVPEVGHDRVIESSRGLGRDDITFRQLGGKTASVQVFSNDAFGYVFTFALPGSAARIDVDYRIPEPVYEVTGRLDPAAKAVCTIRLTGELASFPVEGRATTGHRLTVEVPVDETGAFRFPRLPELDGVQLEGRAAADPWRFIPLQSDPSLAHGLPTNRGRKLEIRVSE